MKRLLLAAAAALSFAVPAAAEQVVVTADRMVDVLDEGIDVTESVQEQDSLENAYLRLLREDGRPV